MNKPIDLFDYLVQDAEAAGQSSDPTQVVTSALTANNVPSELKEQLAPMVSELKLPASRVEMAQKDAMDLVSSDPFLREISQEIGVPHDGETEDDFVKRAKEIIRKILEKFLK